MTEPNIEELQCRALAFGLDKIDRAVENAQEHRFAAVKRDETQCRCGQWHVKDEAESCEVCQVLLCPNCLKPAVNPLSGQTMEHICEVCRENIVLMHQQAAFWARRGDIAKGLNEALADLEEIFVLPIEQWSLPLGRVRRRLRLMRAMYGLED